jgi:alpha 1,3-glucosidase
MNEPAVFDQPDCTVPRDTQHFDGTEDRAVHNLYGHHMISATYEGQLSRNANRDERTFILTRSFFSGSQKYAWTWTGDNTADWNHLRNSLPEILSLGISGFPFAGADVGGFFGSPDTELLVRWYQVGAYCYPFFRCHCHHLSHPREPYKIEKDGLAMVRKAIIERYELLPVWYTAAKNAFDTGEPVVRPLWWEFTDAEVQDLETQIMIFDCLLVAPVLDSEPERWQIYFPINTRWFDYRTLREMKVGFFSLSRFKDVPVYIRGGKIIAVRRTQRKSSQLMLGDPFELIVALDQEERAEGRLYVDDGHTFNYEKGAFLYWKFEFAHGRLTVSNYMEGNRTSSFVNGYSCMIGKIAFLGLGQVPLAATDEGGHPFRTEARGAHFFIRRAELPLTGNWSVILSF